MSPNSSYRANAPEPSRADYAREILDLLDYDGRRVGSSPSLRNHEMAALIRVLLDEDPHQYTCGEKRRRLSRAYSDGPQPKRLSQLRKSELRGMYRDLCEQKGHEVVLGE